MDPLVILANAFFDGDGHIEGWIGSKKGRREEEKERKREKREKEQKRKGRESEREETKDRALFEMFLRQRIEN